MARRRRPSRLVDHETSASGLGSTEEQPHARRAAAASFCQWPRLLCAVCARRSWGSGNVTTRPAGGSHLAASRHSRLPKPPLPQIHVHHRFTPLSRLLLCGPTARSLRSTQPFAVHATYSLDWHDGNAKRQRFREAGLWEADPSTYYQGGRFLALNFSVPPAVEEGPSLSLRSRAAASASMAGRRAGVGRSEPTSAPPLGGQRITSGSTRLRSAPISRSCATRSPWRYNCGASSSCPAGCAM